MSDSPLEEFLLQLLVDGVVDLDLPLIGEHSEKHVDGDLLRLVGEGVDVGSAQATSKCRLATHRKS